MIAAPDPQIPEPVRVLVRALADAGHDVAVVGGFLRDALRGRPGADVDLATDATTAQVLALFPRAVPIGRDTAMVPTAAGPVDVTPYRGAGPTDGLGGAGGGCKDAAARRRGAVAAESALVGDLAHRDFTVNAIAWVPRRGQWVDPFGGRDDLEAGTLRAVGALRDRLAEDPLRALRAARFVATLGLAPTPGMAEEIRAALPSLRGVAPERTRRELERLLLAPSAGDGLALLRESGVEAALTPLSPDAPVRRWIDRLPRRLEIRLAAWLAGTDPQVTMGPLRFGERRIAAVARRTSRHPIDLRCKGAGSRGALRHLLARTSPALVDDLIAMREAETGAPLEALRADLSAITREETPILGRGDLALDGVEVMQVLGLAPGRRVGEAIGYLLDRVLDDPSLNTAARLRSCLEAWSRENP